MKRGKSWSARQEIFHLTQCLDGSKQKNVKYNRKEAQQMMVNEVQCFDVNVKHSDECNKHCT